MKKKNSIILLSFLMISCSSPLVEVSGSKDQTENTTKKETLLDVITGGSVGTNNNETKKEPKPDPEPEVTPIPTPEPTITPEPEKNDIGKLLDLYNKNTNISKIEINRIKGENNIFMQTDIEYTSIKEIVEDITEKAKNNLWTDERKELQYKAMYQNAKGGLILLKIGRITIGSANTDNFEIVVRDKNEEDIYREKLESQIPDVPSFGEDIWTNIKVIGIKEEVPDSFYVYVIDDLINGPTKFEVNIFRN